MKNIEDKFVKVNKTMEGISKEYQHIEGEIKNFGKELDDQNLQLAKKLTIKDGERLWRHFQRFSEYDDLKDLYAKCIPQLSNFENKLIDYSE